MVFQSQSRGGDKRIIHGPERNINASSVDVVVKICSRSIQSSEGINYTQIELCSKMGRMEGV